MNFLSILLLLFFFVSCVYEAIKAFNKRDYNYYFGELLHVISLPLFTTLAYLTIIIISRIILPAKFNCEVFIFCLMILGLCAQVVLVILSISSESNPMFALFAFFSFLWIFPIGCAIDSVRPGKQVVLKTYSLNDHFTSDLLGAVLLILLIPSTGFLAHHGLFRADSFLDKVFGWIIANCSLLLLAILFFSSTLIEMCKLEKKIIYSTWTRRKILSTFLPSMIRSSVFQVLVYPGLLLTYMLFLDHKSLNFCFKVYYVHFLFVFRVFPSFNWATCLSGSPRRHTEYEFSDWLVFETAFANNYTWLLAYMSTIVGCTVYSFIFKEDFKAVFFSFGSFYAYNICRFFGIRIHAKASMAHRTTPPPVWNKATPKSTPPQSQRTIE